jgi:hypothetical protein
VTIARARRWTKVFASPMGERMAASPHYALAVRISGIVMVIAGLTIAGSSSPASPVALRTSRANRPSVHEVTARLEG